MAGERQPQARTVDPRRHTIYRGCTHPATFAGVPVTVFVLSIICFALPGFWAMPFFPMVAFAIWGAYVPVFIALRLVSRRDPYTLTQGGVRLMRRLRNANRGRWGALTYSPFRFDQ